jgi:hypothetical protein
VAQVYFVQLEGVEWDEARISADEKSKSRNTGWASM